MTDQTIEVHFTHPRISGNTLVADISPHCTGHEALLALLSAEPGEAPFLTQLDGQDYELSLDRTGKAITPNMTFAQAGVTDGDTVRVDQSATGAGQPLSGRRQQLISGVTSLRPVTSAARKSNPSRGD